MRRLVLGLLGTFAVGLLLILGERIIDTYLSGQNPRIDYEVIVPDFEVSSSDLPGIAPAQIPQEFQDRKQTEIRDAPIGTPVPYRAPPVRVQILRIENTGNTALANQRIDIIAQGPNSNEVTFLYTQRVISPGGEEDSISRVSDNGRSIGINYSLLDVGDVQILWIVTNQETDIEVIARRPGLKVYRSDLDLRDSIGPRRSNFRQWLNYLLPILVAFIGGAIVCLLVVRRLLKKGYFLDTLAKASDMEPVGEQMPPAASTTAPSTSPTGRG